MNQAANEMTAVECLGVVFGPGWATALTASILIFFCALIHGFSIFSFSRTRPQENITPQPPNPNAAGEEEAGNIGKKPETYTAGTV